MNTSDRSKIDIYCLAFVVVTFLYREINQIIELFSTQFNTAYGEYVTSVLAFNSIKQLYCFIKTVGQRCDILVALQKMKLITDYTKTHKTILKVETSINITKIVVSIVFSPFMLRHCWVKF